MDKYEKLAMQHMYERLEAHKKECYAWRKFNQGFEYDPVTGEIVKPNKPQE
jgi:hypothetical protein